MKTIEKKQKNEIKKPTESVELGGGEPQLPEEKPKVSDMVDLDEENDDEEPAEQEFTHVIFLMSKPEADAIMSQRPEVIGSDPDIKKGCSELTQGFDRAQLDGARIVGFTVSCNLAAIAVDAIEIPCAFSAFERRQLADRIRNAKSARKKTKDPEKREELEMKILEFSDQLREKTEQGIESRSTIPNRRYTAHLETLDAGGPAEYIEF